MIVRMSKVEVVGEKRLLQEVLLLLREMGIFHIEPASVGFVDEGHEDDIRSFASDENTLHERMYFEDLRKKIEDLMSYMPKGEQRKSYIEPLAVIDTIAKTIDRHIAVAKDLFEQQDAALKEKTELDRHAIFLGALAPLVKSMDETPDLDFIGMTIKEPGMVDHVREALSRITDWKFGLTTQPAEDGSIVGLITVEKELSNKVKRSLSDEHVPELILPANFSSLSFSDKVTAVKARIAEVSILTQWIDEERSRFAHRWGPIYERICEWIDDRLSMLATSAAAFETRMCFFIHGWMQSDDVDRVRKKLAVQYGGAVMLAERTIREEDLERVPIVLKNAAYFRPFEMFTSQLPLPAYTSYDPTPFIGIFFPVFFGMILGDAGYGLFLAVVSLFLIRKYRKRSMVSDGARILLTASLYTIFFGVLFNEFFGDLPERILHLKPICVERRDAVIPMGIFALAVGVAHVTLGLVFGVITGFRAHRKKEAVYKVLSILIILGLIAVLASLFDVLPKLLSRPIIIAILCLTPLLFFTGGLLAPLELLKSIGNIISYIRIMAIGLTSVLLAFVANQLGGATGDIVTGALVAGLLHLLNIILGVFSPTIHSLRLHYVEFFSKFMEHGGRRFEPLKR